MLSVLSRLLRVLTGEGRARRHALHASARVGDWRFDSAIGGVRDAWPGSIVEGLESTRRAPASRLLRVHRMEQHGAEAKRPAAARKKCEDKPMEDRGMLV